MSQFVKIILGVILALLLLAAYVFNPRLPSPEGEQSAALYESGALGVARERIELVDSSRPTQPNGDFEGSPVREFDGFVWYPEEQGQKPFPLIVYSHGYMSSVAEPEYLVEFLVPKGYVVVAVNYPLSRGGAPGGPNAQDVINQAGDVAFVIDTMLARNADEENGLHGLMDPARIAAVGLSLGGLTTQLATFHREYRDPRIDAAVSIAGPSAPLEREFFQTTGRPFMMVAGNADAIVTYEANAAPIPSKVENSLLVTLDKGSHTGFTSIAASLFRWFQHPDKLVCPMLLNGLDGEDDEVDPILELNSAAGISDVNSQPCTMEHFDPAMRPAQQQMLTRLAVYAFLEKQFARDADRRQQMERYLTKGLPAENPAVTVE